MRYPDTILSCDNRGVGNLTIRNLTDGYQPNGLPYGEYWNNQLRSAAYTEGSTIHMAAVLLGRSIKIWSVNNSVDGGQKSLKLLNAIIPPIQVEIATDINLICPIEGCEVDTFKLWNSGRH
jgi:hypothetical protein